MKTWIKRLVGVVLTLALVVTMIPVTTAKAETKSITMYVGEAFTYTVYGNGITSVSSNKKSVVKVEKDKTNSDRIIFTAKKTGKAKLTVKYKNYSNKVYTNTINVTVKKRDLTVKMQKMKDGYVLLSVKNNTKQTFDYAKVAYVLKNQDGEVVAEDSKDVAAAVAGKTAYEYIYYDNYSYDIDITQCSAKVVSVDRNPSYSYSDMNKNLTYEVTTETENDNYGSTYETLSVYYKNKYKDRISGNIWVLLYDENDELIALKDVYVSLKGKASDTQKIKIYEDNYDHYEIKVGVYYKKYN